ncbi:Ig-like domain-containing protein [Gordonia sp. NPDC003422]
MASSGIAAALLAVAPVAVSAAEDSPSGSRSGSDSSSESADSQQDSSSKTDDDGDSANKDDDGDSPKKDDAGNESGSPGSPSGDKEHGDENADDEAEPAEKSETPPENTTAPKVAETTPDVTQTEVTTPARRTPSLLPRPHKTYTVPGLSTPDHDRDSGDAPPKSRKVADPVDVAAPVVAATPAVAPVGLDLGESKSETAYITALPVKAKDGKDGILSAFTSATGKGGLILLNQSAVVLGVLNRRSRGDGSDYLGILGPGERLTLPTQVVATGSLGKHTWDDEADGVELNEPVVQSFLSRSVVAFDVVVPDAVDEGNLFYDNGDADFTLISGAESYVPNAIAGDPVAAGVTYRASDDGSTVTITNNGTNPIAIGDSASSSPGSVVIVEPGGSADFATSNTQILVVQGQRVGADGVTPEAGGTPVVLGQIDVAASSIVTTAEAVEDVNGNSIPNAALQDWAGLDPDDRFLDGADDPAPTETVTFESADGVTYEVAEDGSTITFHNDSGRDIGVIAVNLANQGPVGDGIYVIGAGDSAVLPVPADATYYMVQADRTTSGPVVLGAVLSFDGQTASPPFGASPPIKTVEQASVDPDNDYVDPYDADYEAVPTNTTVADWYHEGVYYSRDDSSVTIHNDSDRSVGVVVTSGTTWQLDVIESGGEKTYVPSGVDNPTFLYVQAPRRDDGSAAPYGYVGINFDGTTTQVVSGDLNSSDNIAAMGTNKWVDPDPSNNYWDPRDDDPLAIANSVYPANGVYGSLGDVGVAADVNPGTGSVTISNDGDENLVVLVYSQDGEYEFVPLPAGGSGQFVADTSHVYLVQGARNDMGQPVIYGFVGAGASGVQVLDGDDLVGTSTPTGHYTGTVDSTLSGTIQYQPLSLPAHGTVTVDPQTGNYLYVPGDGVEHDAAGDGPKTDTFAILALGSSGEFRVIPVVIALQTTNDNPELVGHVDNGSSGTVTVSDADGDVLEANYGETPSEASDVEFSYDEGSTIEILYNYTPSAEVAHAAAGDGPKTDSFTIVVSDGHGGTITIPITVAITPQNENPVAPEIVSGGYTGSVAGADADGDALTYVVSDAPEHGTVVVNADGTFTYTPNDGVAHAAAAGGPSSDEFTVTVDDGHGGTDTSVVTVAITPENENPVIGSITPGTADPVTGAVTYTVTTTDADGDTVTYTVTGDGSGGTIVKNDDGTFTYTPDATQTAGYTEKVTVTLQDGHAGQASQTFDVVIPEKQTPEEPEQNFFERVFAAIQTAVASFGESVSVAWQAFLDWLIGLFSQQNSSSNS